MILFSTGFCEAIDAELVTEAVCVLQELMKSEIAISRRGEILAII